MLSRIAYLLEDKLRRAIFWSAAAVAVAVGAGLATLAGLAALAEAGLSEALRLLVVSCVWFGIGGLLALVATAKGARPTSRQSAQPRPATTGLAEAFSAGFSEGATSANRQTSR
ncbi:MAG: hypothetical protein OQK00_02510 [Rhodobacteraceae bacterium]|nr:hypothetical protein [Paracoccaceae bacterium]MCW9044225.1 hypothetical protein [Pseudopelagicola sp.]